MSVWLRLLQALLVGCRVGFAYGFLRPLRPRFWGDLLFLPVLLQGWLYLGLGLCGGDLRLAYTIFFLMGIILWQISFDRWLRPVFSCFWQLFYRIFAFLGLPFKWICKKSAVFLKSINSLIKR